MFDLWYGPTVCWCGHLYMFDVGPYMLGVGPYMFGVGSYTLGLGLCSEHT